MQLSLFLRFMFDLWIFTNTLTFVSGVSILQRTEANSVKNLSIVIKCEAVHVLYKFVSRPAGHKDHALIHLEQFH